MPDFDPQRAKDLETVYQAGKMPPEMRADYEKVRPSLRQSMGGEEKPTSRSLGGAVLEGVENIPGSAISFGKDVVQPFLHPIDTAKSMKDLGLGVMEKLGIKGGSEHEKYADAVGQMLKDRYGSYENIKNTLATDPVGMAADVSMIFTGGGSAAARAPGVVGKLGEVAKTAGRFTDPISGVVEGAKGLGKGAAVVTGGLETFTSPESIVRGVEAGYKGGQARDDFVKNLRSQGAGGADIVKDARLARDTILKERGDAYRAGMAAGVNTDRTILSWNDVDRALVDMDKTATFSGMSGAGPTQSLSKSTENVRRLIQNKIDDWKQLQASEYWTPLGFDALKRSVGDIADRMGATQPGSPAHRVAMQAYGAIKDTIVKQAPAYAKIMESYDAYNDVIKELDKTLSLNPNATVDTALRKLVSVSRNNAFTNYGSRKELVDLLVKAGAPHMREKLAGQDLSSWFPRGIGRYVASGTLAGAYANPMALTLLPFMSPRLVGEGAHLLGGAARGAETLRFGPAARAGFQVGRATDALNSQGDAADELNAAQPQ